MTGRAERAVSILEDAVGATSPSLVRDRGHLTAKLAVAITRTAHPDPDKAAGLGMDGWYVTAWYSRSGKPAIVVTTSAMTEEIVPFANTGDARAWLTSRAPGSTGSLLTTADGPVTPRTVREEEILAWLVRSPRDATAVLPDLGPAPWTTHLRAELATALRWTTSQGGTPGYGVIAEAFGRRLLRAPGAASHEIGWPHATRAMGYLQRLAATSVTRDQAHQAAEALANADSAALSLGVSPGTMPSGAPTAGMAVPRQAAWEVLPRPPSGPLPGSPGPVPRA